MGTISQTYRLAFADWLRTGRWANATRPGDVELKFNPYHDPRNGQFTFAPGGPRSLSRVIVSHRRQHALPALRLAAARDGLPSGDLMVGDAAEGAATFQDAVYRPGEHNGSIILTSRIPRAPGGSNISAFHDPMTLQQAVPNIQGQPGGAIIALAENFLDYKGPARELTARMTQDWSNQLINQIRSLDPDYRFDSLGFPQTLQG